MSASNESIIMNDKQGEDEEGSQSKERKRSGRKEEYARKHGLYEQEMK